MPSHPIDDLTGALNWLTHGDELEKYENLKSRYHRLIRGLCTIIEMECMSDYHYILEIYDSAVAMGLNVINEDFPKATTNEDFAIIFGKMEVAVDKLEAVDRVITGCVSRKLFLLR
ncbi:Protein CBG17564 [Caenorhabditis briggsae]|uniref:Protein CBG17564 n=1 Tax=Caenorhabditis briggsae TaxID=6238 RepID=A8XR91_CAEBR|nr:Protein CBG17564 [Caenorhabditis briggsae]CAP35188.1 Protein CBG17564 [Caenorhabditis briggsae]